MFSTEEDLYINNRDNRHILLKMNVKVYVNESFPIENVVN